MITYLSIVPVMLGVGLATFVSNILVRTACEHILTLYTNP